MITTHKNLSGKGGLIRSVVVHLQSSVQSVHDDTEGDKEGGQVYVDTCQRSDHGSPSQQKHGGDEDVGEEAETEEDNVCHCAPSGKTKEDRTGVSGRGKNSNWIGSVAVLGREERSFAKKDTIEKRRREDRANNGIMEVLMEVLRE